MRVHVLLVAVCILHSSGICYSQKGQPLYEHPQGKKNKGPLTNVPAATTALSDMLGMLGKTKNNNERADIFFFLSRYYAERLKIDSALYFAEKINETAGIQNELIMGKYYLSRTTALHYRGQGDIGMLNKAKEIFSRHRNAFYLGQAHRQLARHYDQVREYDASRQNNHTAIFYLSAIGEERDVQRAWFELGRSFYLSFERDSAVFYLLRALRIAEKINDPGRIFNASGMLGELYLVSDDLANAGEYFRYALVSRTANTSRVEVRNRISSYIQCLILMKDFSKADSLIKEYQTINDQLGDNWGAINLSKIKGVYYYYRKNYSQALGHFRTALGRIHEIKTFTNDVKNIYLFLAKAEVETGAYDEALAHFKYARKLATDLRSGADLMEATLLISRCYQKKGDADSAYQYFIAYDAIKDSLFTLRKENMVIELTTRYETEKKEQQITLLQREKKLSAFELKARQDEIERQKLLDARKTQQLALLSQQNQISRLEASEKTLAFENQQKEMVKKQNELALLAKENELQAAIAAKVAQRNKFAYMAIAAVLLFSGYVFYRFFQNRKLSRRLSASLSDLRQAQDQLIKIEKEKEAENIRVRISRDIHDEVGATLSGVALFSEIAREKMKQQQGDDAQIYLDHITVNSKEMVDKMSDIVWAINPDNDSVDRIIAKLKSYAFNLCAGKGITLHTAIDESIREYYPPMQVKRNLYLLMKEAINNAVKYSEGKNIYLSLQQEGDHIVAGIIDDGKGFDSDAGHEGNGLKNMKARAASLDGRLVIDSQEGNGTRISLQFNFHPAGGRPAVV